MSEPVDTDLLSTWKAGDYEISVFRTCDLEWTVRFSDDRPWAMPGDRVDADGRVHVGANAMCINGQGRVVVIDPAYFATEPDVHPARLIPGPDIVDTLERIGVSREGVTDVIGTHLHFDHINGVARAQGDGWEPMFPNARVLIPEADWKAVAGDAVWSRKQEITTALKPVEEAGNLVTVANDELITPDLELLHTPGETPGHMVVRLDTHDGDLYYLGDLVHFRIEFQEIDFALHHADAAAMATSRRRIFPEVALSGATVVFTHADFPYRGKIEAIGDDSWAFEYADIEAK
jgi:glyoxylase-like metal-dependent hydrolase (beta-lactamase superfamily II)